MSQLHTLTGTNGKADAPHVVGQAPQPVKRLTDRQSPGPVAKAKPRLAKGRNVDDTVLESVMARARFLTAGLTTDRIDHRDDRPEQLLRTARGYATDKSTAAAARPDGPRYVFEDRFDIDGIRVINDAGVYYFCIDCTPRSQGGSLPYNPWLRDDQADAVTAILKKLWGPVGHAARARTLCRRIPERYNYMVPMPVNSKELGNEDWSHRDIKLANLPYAIAAIEVLRVLTGDDLVAYGAGPWVETDHERREREQAELRAAVAKGDPAAKLKMIKQQMQDLARRRKWAEQHVRDTRKLLADSERELAGLDREENKVRRQLGLSPLPTRTTAKTKK